MYVMITWLLLLVSIVTQGTQHKATTDWKTDSQMDWLYFTENLFYHCRLVLQIQE